MTLSVGINGFGRIGRLVARMLANDGDLRLTAVNSRRGDPELLCHLLAYDSVHGRFDGRVTAEPGRLLLEGRSVRLTSAEKPAGIAWEGVDAVVESTGAFTNADDARGHLGDGVEHVIVTAPAAGEDLTLVMGVNDKAFDPRRHAVLSTASCTTACLGPVASVLHEAFGIESAVATTVHSFTRDQELVDGSHDDPRRGRSAALNIVPTRTGAAAVLARVLPELAGRIDALAVRVPTPDVSLLMLTARTRRAVDVATTNAAFRGAAASSRFDGVLGVSDLPLVSSDFRGDTRSAVLDTPSTVRVGDRHVQVMAWYDNELGYAARVVEALRLIATGRRSPAPAVISAGRLVAAPS